MKRSTILGIAACALFVASIGCTSVLGLDPPYRDPCANGECADASSDPASEDPPATFPDAGGTSSPGIDSSVSPPTPDASRPDTAPASRLIRCGGPDTGIVYCDQAAETCCAFGNNDGSFTFSCLDLSLKCPGVPIGCAKQADCDSPSICCVDDTFQSCVTHGTCNGDVVCDPASPTQECAPPLRCLPYPNPAVPYSFCQ